MRLLSSGSTLALTATAALVAATSHAQVFSNPAPIPIGDAGAIGVAAPYPATITVSGFTGTITDLDVRIAGLFHTFPDDVDVMLVGPTGAAVVFRSDAGGSADAVGVALEFDDEAAAGIPDGGPIVTGHVPAQRVRGRRRLPRSGPGTARGLGAVRLRRHGPERRVEPLRGGRPGGRRRRHPGRLGASTSPTSTTAETTVPSAATIRIHDRWGTGTPNPSQIVVSGAPPQLTSITVTLNGLSHLNPDDLDIVLVGPTGATFVFWSDAGGTVDVVNANVTLDDAGATVLPDATVIATGTFQPRNYGTG